ncbi:MAG TPA: hypothetical protein VFB19_15720 [Mycobacterium sp.]|nr:hypothetical protein [Mycobacterium sp.]
MSTGWDRVRAVADAVLYEGYLLYPYRATSGKNQSRWQFGVVGPPGAEAAGIGENDTMSAEVLVDGEDASVSLVLRFLQLQHRSAQRHASDGRFEPVDELTAGASCWLTWDEAVEQELVFGPFAVADLEAAQLIPVSVAGGSDIEGVDGGRLARTRRELSGELTLSAERDDGLARVSVEFRNTAMAATDKDDAVATSFIGTHFIAEVSGGQFVSLLDPPAFAAGAVARCGQHRCFPVLAGPPGHHDLMLVSPIILYDHPEVAEQSEGALYDSTEIDEILTLRVMTMTDEEKAQARATDPLAARIIDRCDSMSPEAMLNLHGVLRNPHAPAAGGSQLIPAIPEGIDWWDPTADTAVQPEIDAVLVNGVPVTRGSTVRLRPSRRADAQDMFFSGKTARVTSVHQDVDGNQHVAVVVEDDPAADLHDWYGRYLYFAPDEVEPLTERNVRWK